MKVLMTADTLGGVWTYTIELCAALSTQDVEVDLATMGRLPSRTQWRELAQLDNVRLHPSAYRLCWMKDPWDDVLRAGRWLLDLERKVRPDVIHHNDLGHADLPFEAPVYLMVHSCVLSWWQAVKGEAAPPEEWRTYREVVRRGLLKADLVAAPTATLLRSLGPLYGAFRDPNRTAVVFNGRSFPALARAPLQSRDIGDGESGYIFSCGRLWDEAKNFRALARAAAKLKWPVYVAGEQTGPSGKTFTSSTLNLLGTLSSIEVGNFLRGASIYASPALYEPFGLGILEAARSRAALVLGDIDSLREVWGDAAWYVDPHDDDALHRALERLIHCPQTREELATKAWSRATRFSARTMGQQTFRHYLRLIARRTQTMNVQKEAAS